MECYRTNCKEECNNLKVKYCLYKITKIQSEVIADIRKETSRDCKNCGDNLIAAKYRNREIKLCTNCGIATNGQEIVRKCLINSRRVS